MTQEQNQEKKTPTVAEMVKNLKEQMPLKRLQVELQSLNTSFVEMKVREMEAIHKLQQIEAGQMEARVKQEQYMKDNIIEHTITQEDMDMNPEMADQGIKVGQVIGIPKDIYQDLKLSNKKDIPSKETPATEKGVPLDRKLKVVED